MKGIRISLPITAERALIALVRVRDLVRMAAKTPKFHHTVAVKVLVAAILSLLPLAAVKHLADRIRNLLQLATVKRLGVEAKRPEAGTKRQVVQILNLHQRVAVKVQVVRILRQLAAVKLPGRATRQPQMHLQGPHLL